MLSRAASIAGWSQRCLRHEELTPRCCASVSSAQACAPRRSMDLTLRARRTPLRVESRPKLIELSFLDHSLPLQPRSRKRATVALSKFRNEFPQWLHALRLRIPRLTSCVAGHVAG